MKIRYKNKTYKSYNGLMREYDIYDQRETFRRIRKSKGLTKAVEYCIGVRDKGKYSPRRLKYNGKEYRNIQELVAEYNVSYYDFKRFYKETNSVTKALQKSQNIKKKIKLYGKEYRFYQQVIDEYGITDYQSFYGILKKEKDIEIALEGAMINEYVVYKRQSRTQRIGGKMHKKIPTTGKP